MRGRDGGNTWEIKRSAAPNGRVTNVLRIPSFEEGRGAFEIITVLVKLA